jgi:cytidyltransferase-like protein
MSVLVSGGFDVLHPGHVAYLKAAREYGDGSIVCAIASDDEVATKHRVVLPLKDRIVLLTQLGLIDEFTTLSVADALYLYQVTHYVKGKDWEGKLPADQVVACHELGIQIVHTDTVTHSSTRLLCGPSIDDFEQLVLSQKPAEKPWQPTAAVPYDFASRKIAEGKHPQRIKDVLQPKTLLDYGCGPGHLVRLLREIDVDAYGYEPFLEPDQAVKSFVFRPWQAHGHMYGDCWDVIVCREVFEHCTVGEIAGMVRRICSMEPRLIYLTTRFAQQPKSVWQVDTSDNLDPTHRTMLHPDLLRSWFVLEGFKRRADLEAQMDHLKKGRVLVYERA